MSPEVQTTTVENANAGTLIGFLQKVLFRWLHCAPPFPTLTKLCGALRSHAVGQIRIAHELEQQYQTKKRIDYK